MKIVMVPCLWHRDWISGLRKGEGFNMNPRFLSVLIEWIRGYRGRNSLMGNLILLILGMLKLVYL